MQIENDEFVSNMKRLMDVIDFIIDIKGLGALECAEEDVGNRLLKHHMTDSKEFKVEMAFEDLALEAGFCFIRATLDHPLLRNRRILIEMRNQVDSYLKIMMARNVDNKFFTLDIDHEFSKFYAEAMFRLLSITEPLTNIYTKEACDDKHATLINILAKEIGSFGRYLHSIAEKTCTN